MQKILTTVPCFLILIISVIGYASSDVSHSKEQMTPYEQSIEQSGGFAQSDYVAWNLHPNCMIQFSNKPILKVCIHINSGQNQSAQVNIRVKKALELWLEAVAKNNSKVTRKVELTCDSPHGTVYVNPGYGREMAGPGWVQMYEQSVFGSILHEFGHAFACLGDTYLGSQAGYCQSGQPHSIMCDGLLREDLTEDDVQGVQAQYKMIH